MFKVYCNYMLYTIFCQDIMKQSTRESVQHLICNKNHIIARNFSVMFDMVQNGAFSSMTHS